MPLRINEEAMLQTNTDLIHFDLLANFFWSTVVAELVEFQLFVATLAPHESLAVSHGHHVDSSAAAGALELVFGALTLLCRLKSFVYLPRIVV